MIYLWSFSTIINKNKHSTQEPGTIKIYLKLMNHDIHDITNVV